MKESELRQDEKSGAFFLAVEKEFLRMGMDVAVGRCEARK